MGERCQHADQPHTMRWWDREGELITPYPASARFDNHDDAIAAAVMMRDDIEAGRLSPVRFPWIKVFRLDNESYTCWHYPTEDRST
jgi:hypothetical protein